MKTKGQNLVLEELKQGDVISKNILYPDPVYYQITFIGCEGIVANKYYQGRFETEVYLKKENIDGWKIETNERFKKYRQDKIKQDMEEVSSQIAYKLNELDKLKEQKLRLEKEYNNLFNSVNFILE